MNKVTRAAAAVVAVVAVLWLTATCSGTPPARGPASTPLPAPAPEPASLLYVHLDDGIFLSWPGDRRADRYVITRLFYGNRVIPAGTTVYTWFDAWRGPGLRGSFAHPGLVVVRAMRGSRVLHTYTRGESCPSLVLVAARGSADDHPAGRNAARGLGARAGSVWETLVRRFGTTGTDLPAIPVDYPAVAVPRSAATVSTGHLQRPYRRSVGQGVADALRVIDWTVLACPRIDIILFGSFQGAHVVADAYADLARPLRDRVVRVILFADPRYRAHDRRVRYLPHPLTGHGILGERRGMPQGRAVIESWCAPRDATCHVGIGDRHVHGRAYDLYVPMAVHDAVRAIHVRPRTPIT